MERPAKFSPQLARRFSRHRVISAHHFPTRLFDQERNPRSFQNRAFSPPGMEQAPPGKANRYLHDENGSNLVKLLPPAPDSLQQRILKRVRRMTSKLRVWLANRQQMRNIRALAEELRKVFPKLEFAVCGIGKTEPLPPWIKDLRTETFVVETNHSWSVQASQSHSIIGVHGSHLDVAPDRLPGVISSSFPMNFFATSSPVRRSPSASQGRPFISTDFFPLTSIHSTWLTLSRRFYSTTATLRWPTRTIIISL